MGSVVANRSEDFMNWVNRFEAQSWLETVREKYEMIGRPGGVVFLDGLSPQAKVGLVELLGRKPVSKEKGWKLSLSLLEKRLIQVYGHTLADALNVLYGQPIETRQQNREKTQAENIKLRDRLLVTIEKEKKTSSTPVMCGFLDILSNQLISEKSPIFRYILYGIQKQGYFAEQDVNTVIRAVAMLDCKCEYTRLAPFAQKAAENPHAFDFGTPSGRLFYHVLSWLFPKEEWNINSVVERDMLLARVGLARDLISSWVVISGFKTFNETGKDLLLELANRNGRYFVATLQDVSSWSRITANKNVAFAVENAQVFELLWERTKAIPIEERPALLYSGGWFSAAALRFLDNYLKGNNILYYSGDFEPGGIRIAKFLMKRYGEKLKMWRMGEEEYQSALKKDTSLVQNKWNDTNEMRSRALIEDDQFLEQTKKRPAFQEGILEVLYRDITVNIYFKGYIMVE